MTRSLSICIACCLYGCATGPYAIVDGRIGVSAPLDTAGVAITGVDGRAFFDGKVERNVEPGFHALEVVSTRKSTSVGRNKDRADTFTPAYVYLTAQPCMHYYIVARHESGLDVTKWRPEIARSEPIEGCKEGGVKPPIASGPSP